MVAPKQAWLVVLLAMGCGGNGGMSSPADADVIDAQEVVAIPEIEPADNGPEADAQPQTFPRTSQTPLYEKGLVLPPNSLPCVPVSTGVPQNACNHHGSTIAELPDGGIAVAWFHGEYEKSPDSRIVWARRLPGVGSLMFSAPQVLFDDPGRAEGNSTLWVDSHGVIRLLFVTIFGASWDDDKVRMISSADGGATWGSPVMLHDGRCWEIRTHPVRLSNGEVLVPLNDGCKAIPVFFRTHDEMATWTEEEDTSGQFFVDHVEQTQPVLVDLGGGRVAAIMRDGLPSHRIKRMTSADYGHTWTAGAPLGLPNPGASVDQVRLLDGTVVVVFNNAPNDRFPLSAALSEDGGETYTVIRDLDAECPGGGCEFSYPSVIQSTRDGTIWVSYTHNRQTIGWVHFNEAWLWGEYMFPSGEKANFNCLMFERCVDGACFKACKNDSACQAPDACLDGACRLACTSDADCDVATACQEGSCACWNDRCLPLHDLFRVDVVCSGDGPQP